MTEKKTAPRHVNILVEEDLHREVRMRLAEENGSFQRLIVDQLRKWVASDDPIPVDPDPLDREALAIRDWLRAADAQPRGSMFRIQAEMFRKMVKIAVPEPVEEPVRHAESHEKERRHHRDGLHPTEEPA
jgi:hypothetical protein